MLRWLVVAMAANAQQCDELPYEVATYAFTITARDGHAIDARVYAPSHHEAGLVRDASGVILSEGATVKVIKDIPIRVDRPEAEGGLLGREGVVSEIGPGGYGDSKIYVTVVFEELGDRLGDHGHSLEPSDVELVRLAVVPPEHVDQFAFAGVVYAHGGCFAEGDCESFEELGRGFARRGLMVLDTSFRQGATNPHPGALRDLGDVAAWANDKFNDLSWGVAGSSSGGYLALALAADPFRWGSETEFYFTLALCPVADPLARAEYLRAVINGTSDVEPQHEPERAREILANQLSYFPGGDAEMAAARDLVEDSAAGPTFVVAGAWDKNVPLHVLTKVMSWATRTLVLGERGHEIQAALKDEDYDEIMPWLRRTVRNQEEFEKELLEKQRSKRSKS
jgi:acetyl esterase/lipase